MMLLSRRAVTAAAAAALVAAAGFVQAMTPAAEEHTEPFIVETQPGEEGTGRNIAVTVHDARLAEEVNGKSTPGIWLVIDLEAQAVVDDRAQTLAFAELHTGGVRYRASERFSLDSLFQNFLLTGLAQRGDVVFEIPEVTGSGDGTLQFGGNGDPRMDSVIQVPLELEGLPRSASVQLRTPELVR